MRCAADAADDRGCTARENAAAVKTVKCGLEDAAAASAVLVIRKEFR